MKLKSVTLENFGIYPNRRLDFDASPLVLVYGPNETGKTTALNGLRQSLFGFPHRTSYLVGGKIKSAVRAELSDGRQLEFTRRKSKADSVQAMLDGVEIDEAEVKSFFGNLTLEHYESLFGFSLLELQRGEAELKSTPLFSALSGSGTSGISLLQSLQEHFIASTSELYRQRGSNYPINGLLDQIKEARDRASQLAVTPSTITQLRSEMTATEAEAKGLRASYEKRFRRQAKLEATLRVLPKFLELKSARRQLLETEIPDGIDRVAVSNWQEYGKQRRKQLERRDELQQQKILAGKKLEALPNESGLGPQVAAIERIGHQAADIGFKRQQADENREAVKQSKAVLKELGKDFGYAFEALVDDQFQPPRLSERIRHHGLERSNQATALRSEADDLRSVVRAARRNLDDLQSEFGVSLDPGSESRGSTGWGDVTPDHEQMVQLNRLLDECVTVSGVIREIENDVRLRQDDATFVELERRVVSLLKPGAMLLPSFQVPELSWLEQRIEEQSGLQRRLDSSQEAAKRLESDIKDLSSQEQTASDASGAALLERIGELQERREKLLQNWRDDLSQPLIASTLDSEEQSQRLGELQTLLLAIDDAYAELLQSANTLARIQHAELAIAENASQLETVRRDAESIELALGSVTDEITACFSAVPLRSTESKALYSWTEAYTRWRANREQLDSSRKKLLQKQSVLQNRRELLVDDWPEPLREDFSLAQCQQLIEQWQQSRRSQSDLKQRSEKYEKQYQDGVTRLSEVEAQLSQMDGEFARWLDEQQLKGEWQLTEFDELVASLDRLHHELNMFGKAQRTLESVTAQVSAFDGQVEQIAELLCNSNSSPSAMSHTLAPEDLAKEWLALVQRDRKCAEERLRLTASLEHIEASLHEIQLACTDLDSKLAEIATAVGSAGSVDSVMQSIVQADELRRVVAECNAAMASAGVSTDEFDGVDEAKLTIELRELAAELGQIEKHRQENDQLAGQLAERLKQLSNSSESAEQLQRIESARADLARLTQQWLVQRTAAFVSQRALELHAKENEPRLLKLSGQYFRDLTGGRYHSIEHQSESVAKNSKAPTICVRRSDGAAMQPAELSTGAREQLYLALRMAFVQQYAETHEPLPILMDDCFVNFDDDRMQSAVRAIGKWDSSIQTILFSCHERTVEVVRQSLPDARVIELAKLAEPAGV